MIFEFEALLEGINSGAIAAGPRWGEIPITFLIRGGRTLGEDRRTTIWLLFVAETFVQSFVEALEKDWTW